MHSKHHAALALTLAIGLAGCHTTLPPDDNALNTAVQSKLASDAAIASEPIQTFVQDGVATLQGSVSSQAASALAASDVSQVPGVRSVVNQLTVQTATPAARRSTRQAASAAHPPAAPKSSKTPPALIARNDKTAKNDAPAPPPPSQPAPIERRTPQQAPEQPHVPPPPPAPAFRTVNIPSGTTLPVRITQTLDSATAQQGDAFSGTLASDVVIDGLVALPAGSTVSGRLDEVHEAAHFKGSALLTLSLVSLSHRGERTPISTEPYTQQGKGRGANTAEKTGGGAAIGAILGGILGGGKGAAIGAATGGGLGAGSNGITRGQQVQIPSETLIRFHLANSIDVRAPTAPAPEGDSNLQRHPGN